MGGSSNPNNNGDVVIYKGATMSDYVPFGPEWANEMQKLCKADLIRLYRAAAMANAERAEPANGMTKCLCEYEFIEFHQGYTRHDSAECPVHRKVTAANKEG